MKNFQTVKEMLAWRDRWAPGATLTSKDEVNYELYSPKKGRNCGPDGQPIVLTLAGRRQA